MRLFSSRDEEKILEQHTEETKETVAEIVEMPKMEEVSNEETDDFPSDSLLAQIDEFRKKAEALQNLINDRQEKYNELSVSLKESEDRYALLQSEVSIKEESMNGIIDAMSEKLDIFADRIDTSVNNTVTESISSLNDTVTESVTSIKDEVSQINTSVSSVSDSIGDSLSGNLTGTISDAVKTQNEPVIEKIHSENVRLYRNLYDFVKEDYSMETIEKMVNTSVKKNRGPIGFCLFMTLLNTALLVCLILFQLGIIKF